LAGGYANLRTARWHRERAMQGKEGGAHPMFIFNRPFLAVLVALTVPVLLVLLDGVFDFGTF
jgi:hypothetical protein